MRKFYLLGIIITTLGVTGCTSSKENSAEVVKNKYNDFMIYNKDDNKNTKFEINLKETNQKILTSEQAKMINAKKFDGKPTDRQEFLDAWEELDKKVKAQDEFVEIQKEYKKTVAVLVASESVLTFYEQVKSDAENIINSSEKIKNLYNKSNNKLGGRGKAYDDYVKVTAYGEDESNSERMLYLKEKYRDTVNFLEAAQFLLDNDIDSAKEEIAKINDSDLKSILESRIN